MKTLVLRRMRGAEFEAMKREITIFKTMDHPNIVKLYETFYEKNKVYILMELCTGGDLFDVFTSQDGGHFSEKRACLYIKKMISAINYMHNKGICHRDLKPENFVFENRSDEAELKLIDFGLSKVYSGSDMHEVLGTCYYVAPEVLNQNYDMKCDLWSIGIIAYMLLTGVSPFSGTEEEVRKERMGKREREREERDFTFASAQDTHPSLVSSSTDVVPRSCGRSGMIMCRTRDITGTNSLKDAKSSFRGC